MQAETLQKLHQGYQGIQRCRLRANSSVWWPGMSKHINDFISHCLTCCRNAPPQREPLLSSPLPDYPWQGVATDLLELEGATYVVIVDYFSHFPEVIQLRSTTSRSVINTLKTVFSHHGIPEMVMSDNGPQYASTEFEEFATAYGFMHSTSSPYYPQSNGLAERTVKTMKKLLKESSDPSLALLTYRTTPLPWCGLSPAELCFGQFPRTDIPQTKGKLTPDWPYLRKFKDNEHEFKKRQKRNYDERHHVRLLPELPASTEVWVNTDGHQKEGVATPCPSVPRSYTVTTSSRTIHRNRSQLNIVPDSTQLSTSIGSNCPGISGTVPDFLSLSRVPEGPIFCPRSKLGSCTMSHFLLQVIRMSNSTCRTIGYC